jgi:glycosyltransferase involved in cell wall biosynthesis
MIEKNNIKCSLIVPVYNVERYLEKCLFSLVNQTLKDIEIILVNDGSTDSSLKIAQDFADKYENITIVTQVNGGLSAARNTGIKHSTADYLAFIDSDDYVDITMIEKMFNMAICQSADIVVCDMKYVFSDHMSFSSGGTFKSFNAKDNPELIGINNSACNKLFKRDLFNDINFPIGLWYEDLGTIPILYLKADKVVKIDEVLYYYLQREDSIAHSISPKVFHVYDAIGIVEKYIEQNCVENKKEYINVVHQMYMNHGLYLTTLRITSLASSRKEAEKYLEVNLQKVNHFYPMWTKNVFINTFNLKVKLIFLLYKLRFINVIAYILVH